MVISRKRPWCWCKRRVRSRSLLALAACQVNTFRDLYWVPKSYRESWVALILILGRRLIEEKLEIINKRILLLIKERRGLRCRAVNIIKWATDRNPWRILLRTHYRTATLILSRSCCLQIRRYMVIWIHLWISVIAPAKVIRKWSAEVYPKKVNSIRTRIFKKVNSLRIQRAPLRGQSIWAAMGTLMRSSNLINSISLNQKSRITIFTNLII